MRFAEALELATEDLPSPRDAVVRASALAAGHGWILVTGSLRIVGEVRSIIREFGNPAETHFHVWSNGLLRMNSCFSPSLHSEEELNADRYLETFTN